MEIIFLNTKMVVFVHHKNVNILMGIECIIGYSNYFQYIEATLQFAYLKKIVFRHHDVTK